MAKHAAQRVQSENRAYPRFIRPTAAALAVAACFSNPALANPTAPTVVHGTASFSTAGNILNVTNSHNAIINWGSFSIGVNELTRFIQPSALSAVLNRVTGQDPSAILGALQSNGRVFLLNPNGIVFGSGAQINVAGLVASTLNLSNDDFLNNRMRFTDGAGAGSVVNNGSITGGNVYLVGNAVTNNGLISSPNGEVVLAAGNSVELVNPGTPNLRVEVVAPDNEARNLGTITAEAGRIGIFAGLINNSGTLNASSAVSEGGRIWLKAKKDITLTSTSVIDASGQGGGEIIAFADNNMYVDGSLNASAPVSGNGGFIETSGKNRVKVADTAFITTVAAQGKTGTWLIDPTDFVIASSSGDTTGSAIAGMLGSTNVIITSTGGSGMYGGGNGDILVNDSISWSSSNSLTLTAVRNVDVNSSISNSYGGGLNLYAGWNGVGDGSAPTLISGAGNINVNQPILVGNNINMAAGGAVTIGAAVTANALPDGGCCSAGGDAAISISGNIVTINSAVNANGGDGSEGGSGGNASIALVAGSQLQINAAVTAQAGNGGSSFSAGGSGGNGGVTLTSGGNIVVNQSVYARGGSGQSGYSSGGAGGNGVVNATAAGDLTVLAYGGGGLLGMGGQGGDANVGTAGRGGDGKVMATAGGAITVESGGQVRGTGGSGGSYSSYGGSAVGGAGGDGVVQLVSSGSTSVMGTVAAQGGWGGEGGEGGGAGNGGSASVSLSSSSAITISGGSVNADGGEGGYASGSYGGSVFGGNGGAATLGMLAGGNILMEGGEGGAWGGFGGSGSSGNGVGGMATVGLVAGGNITLDSASYYETLTAQSGSGGPLASLIVAAAGNVSLLNGANIYSYGTAGLGGANVILNDGHVYAISSASVGATGSLTMTNGSRIEGDGNAYITTGGNVTVDGSYILGSPDVFMKVGGVININNVGRVEAEAPTTIHLTFPMITSGGYFINGIEGVVFDPLTNTGFMANGSAAILGTNLLVTYGGNLNIPTDALIVAMGQSTKPPDPDKDKNVFEDIEDGKKKDAPVCR